LLVRALQTSFRCYNGRRSSQEGSGCGDSGPLAHGYAAQAMPIPPEDVGDGWRKLFFPVPPGTQASSLLSGSRRHDDSRCKACPDATVSGSYQKDCIDLGFLNLIIERRRPGQDDKTLFPTGRWHLSISHNYPTPPGMENRPGRLPTWDEIKQARYKFLPADVNMAIMFPPESMYYNRHPTCLHLLEIPVSLAIDLHQRGGI